MTNIVNFRICLLIFILVGAAFALPAYSADPATTPTPSAGREVSGAPAGTDVQGNPDDKNAQGSRPKDIEGNTPKDMYGNKVGTETK